MLPRCTTSTQAKSVVGSNFNFFEMGIGGLDEEFQVIFRKAFASRAAAPTVRAAPALLLWPPHLHAPWWLTPEAMRASC